MMLWLWRSGPWQGVSGTFGQARAHVSECIISGAADGIVEFAAVRMDGRSMGCKAYFRTGRYAVARRVNGAVQWGPLALAHDDKVPS